MNSNLEALISYQAEYAYNPQKWAYDMFKFEPDRWQDEAMSDYNDFGFCLWCTANGVGKTTLLAILGLHFLATRPFCKIPCTAPTQHQLFDLLWAETSNWLRRSPFLSSILNWTQQKISVKGHDEEWFMVARTSRPKPGEKTAEGIQGFHAPYLLYILDELSGIPDQIATTVEGSLTSNTVRILGASNPTRTTGYLYRNVTDPRLAHLWRIKIVDARNSRLVSKESIERKKALFGEDSDEYRMKVLGLFPKSETQSLLTVEQVFALHNRVLTREGERVLTVDPARYGPDSSLMYIWYGPTAIERLSIQGMNTDTLACTIYDLDQQHNFDTIRIDTIGIGSGVYDNLRAKYKTEKERRRIIPIAVSEAASDPQKYINLRAELGWRLRTLIDTFSVPFDCDFLDEECTKIKYGWTMRDRRLQLQGKEELRHILGRSCGDFDNLLLRAHNCGPAEFKVNESVFSIGSRSPDSQKQAHDLHELRNVGIPKIPAQNEHGSNMLVFPVGRSRYSHLDSHSAQAQIRDRM